jgi:hypothetical protein
MRRFMTASTNKQTSAFGALAALAPIAIIVAGCPGADSTIAATQPVPYVAAAEAAVTPDGTKTKSATPIVSGVLKAQGGGDCDECIDGVSNCGGPCGGGPDPGGQACDQCINGVSNCGGPCGGGGDPGAGGTCGDPGQCACSVGGYGLIGFCGSRPPSAVCTYCPPGTTLSDPCGDKCDVIDQDKAPTPQGTHCPETFPVACGSKSCCPNSHPVCCPNSSYCGNSASACQDAPDIGGSSGGGGGGGCGWSCPAQFRSASTRTGCCSVGSCPDACSDACGNGWYEAKGGQYGPCNAQNTSCMQSAAQAAVNACR